MEIAEQEEPEIQVDMEFMVSDMVNFVINKEKIKLEKEIERAVAKHYEFRRKNYPLAKKMREQVPRILRQRFKKFFTSFPRGSKFTIWEVRATMTERSRPNSEVSEAGYFLRPQMIVCARYKGVVLAVRCLNIPAKVVAKHRKRYDYNEERERFFMALENTKRRKMTTLLRGEKRLRTKLTENILNSTEEGRAVIEQMKQVTIQPTDNGSERTNWN